MSQLKRAVAKVGRRRSFPRRLPASLGGARFYGSTEGGLKFLKRDLASIDPPLTNFALEHVKIGQSVWDIGANLGLFTFTAAGLVGPSGSVLAVEPDTWLVGTLRRAVLANKGKISSVIVLPVAVSNEVGFASFFIANQSRACNSLDKNGNGATGGVRERQYVPTVSLDSLLDHFPKPDVVKVDVEHGELDLLRGARRILTQVKPIMLVEVSDDNQDPVTEILVGSGYHMFDGELGGEVNRATWTTIAIPEV